jgi:ABC-2 type transport system permease protein
MKKLLFIAKFEYLRHITRREFLIALFGMPLFMTLIFGGIMLIMALSFVFDNNEQAVGYVDDAHIIEKRIQIPQTSPDDFISWIPMKEYVTQKQAHTAFVKGVIDAYVVIPSDYLDTGEVTVYSQQRLSYDGQRTLKWLLHQSMLATTSSEIARLAPMPLYQLKHRLISPDIADAENNDQSADETSGTDEETESRGKSWYFPLSLIFGVLFIGTVMTSSSYLLQALVDEKENRTMEIVITSVSPEQLIGGKVLGLGALGLTQSAVWMSYGLGPMAGGAVFFEPLRSFLGVVMGEILPIAMICFVPSYLFYAGIIVTIGSVVGSVQEGQQLSSLVLLPSFLPLLLTHVIEKNPHGAIATVASFFPLTAPITLMMRLAITHIPWWHIVASLLILSTSAVLMIILSARIFRWGMLRYGKPLKLGDIVKAIRQRASVRQ